MTSPRPLTPASVSVDRSLALLVEEWTTRLQAGEATDEEAFLAKHPAHADELRLLLPALRAMAELGRSGVSIAAGVSPEEAMGRLGDFRIVREIGRGGMGIVYEAEQVSLQRRVALKLLPFAATMDARRLQRFQNETLAAAGLHHTNIVPVYFVGCERGVHFYAMQLIEGCTLAAVLRELHWEAGPLAPVKGPARAALASVGEEPPTEAHRPAALMKETQGLAGLSTQGPKRSKEYFQAVARLGVQVAEALDYAHERGVIHRDIKPANLLLDERGVPWVTDFGLAHLQHAEVSLTMTGDLVGTLRYMSPEQALAGPTPVDHRTDVYSLGATLYELLTLRPAFGGSDRQELLRQVAFEEPARPRRLVREVPAELEIIVLKAMEKNPADRYATARELADDLRRWLDDRSILARRPSLVRLAARWSRRHKPLVGAALAVLVMAMVLGGGTWLWWAQKRAGAEGEARAALREAAGLLEQERWPEALSAARRAEGALASVGADPDLRRQARTLIEDLEMGRRLQEARLQGAEVIDGHFDWGARDAAYTAAFQEYGLDVDGLDPQAVAEQIRLRSIHAQLVAALDDWAHARRGLKAEDWKQRLAVARAADPDVLRNRLRDFVEVKDRKTLEEVVAAGPTGDWPVPTLVLLGTVARRTASGERVAALLGQAQQRHPDDFWLNHALGYIHHHSRPPRLEEAIRYHSIAVALRPGSPGTHVNLSWALHDAGKLDAAIAESREAIRLKNDYAEAHNNLGYYLRDKGRLEEAIAEYQEAIRLKKDLFEAHNNLGVALADKDQLEEAIAEYRKALRLNPDLAGIHSNLGNALARKGQLVEAIAEHRKALRLNPDLAGAHFNLGNALRDAHRREEAIAEYRVAIRLNKDDPDTHLNLGDVLMAMGRLDEAIAENREAIRLKKDYAEAHCNLGLVLQRQGRFADALTALKRGHEIGSKNPRWTYPSAQWVRTAEQLVALEGKLPKLLNGEAQPADAAERMALAHLCQEPKKRYAAAARFFAEAFAAQPALADDLRTGNRYNAACSAALAGCGQGKDADKLDTKARAGLRTQALDWLRADLKAYRQVMEKSAGKAAPTIAQQMRRWQQDSDFAGVRGAEAIGKLPEAERQAWQKLWSDVADTLTKAQKKTAPDKK